jgi:EAL domain-containing protein (putative c-di-GMP-specific phosphodiesterase class I)/GGDEF domain-containing protein
MKLRHDAFIEAIGRAATFAFQPIVNIQSGECFGFEALLRNVDRLGFNSISDLFDYAWNAGILHRVDMSLRRIAIAQFARCEACAHAKLFYNIDGRCFESQDYHPHQTIKILEHYRLAPERFVLELSERYDNASAQHLAETLAMCRQQDYQLAIDDFGRGFSEMQMLYEHQPDFIKIDRFFISGISEDSKKRHFVSSIVNLAHVLGVTVVAEGVETEREFLACKSVGCDLVQGFYVARPTTAHENLHASYAVVQDVNARDRRRAGSDDRLIRDQLEPLNTVAVRDDMMTVFEAFRVNKAQSVFPVLGEDGAPLGLLREGDLKDYVYLKYGRELLQNRSYGRTPKDFLIPCPIADVNTAVEKVLEMYATAQDADGIIVTENFRYLGFLNADALLRILNEKNLKLARDQNPLSKLPGNNSVVDYISAGLEDEAADCLFVYFDFNDFKPFNDLYGFRQGDRAITLFADLLRELTRGEPVFLGHIGGDDFFAGFRDADPAHIRARVKEIADRFRQDVESFYTPEHRAEGAIKAKDRYGKMRSFALLSTSAAIIRLQAGPRPFGMDGMLAALANAKAKAKTDPRRIAEVEIPLAAPEHAGPARAYATLS